MAVRGARCGIARSARSTARPKSVGARRCACWISTAAPAEIRARSPIHYTPTFVLVENGEEVGRIEGYPGNDFFFGLLQNLVQRLPGERKL